MKRIIHTLTLIFLLTSNSVWSLTIEDAQDAMEYGDDAAALKIWLSLAEEGNLKAQKTVAFLYQNGIVAPKDENEAQRWYTIVHKRLLRRAEEGDPAAQAEVANMYTHGQGVTQDFDESYRWNRASYQGWLVRAREGDPQAQYEVASAYRKGRGTLEDLSEAERWYKAAANQGFADAAFQLANLYKESIFYEALDHSTEVAPDLSVAERAREMEAWYHVAADAGHIDAKHTLAEIYEYGQEGIPRDYSQAERWYRSAAEQGHAGSQVSLGRMYELGEYLPQNHSNAVRWYRSAANQGSSHAAFRLGYLYGTSEVVKNYPEAVRWYKSAARAFKEAQFNLGTLYLKGKGVTQDYSAAYFWFNVAAANGADGAVEAREEVADKMTPQAIADAQNRARICLESGYQDCD